MNLVSELWEKGNHYQMVEISMENRGQLIGSIDSKDEKFRTLYKRIEKEYLEKHVREIEQARENGFREAKRILEGLENP